MHSNYPCSLWYFLECCCYCTFFEVQYFVIAIVIWTCLTVFFLGRCSKYYVVTSCIQLKADLSLKDIGNMINKVVQGWINYYTHYYKSEFYEVLRYINQCLIKWVRRSYKKKNTRSRAEHWLGAVARRDRNLFAHWKFGILPSVGEGAV